MTTKGPPDPPPPSQFFSLTSTCKNPVACIWHSLLLRGLWRHSSIRETPSYIGQVEWAELSFPVLRNGDMGQVMGRKELHVGNHCLVPGPGCGLPSLLCAVTLARQPRRKKSGVYTTEQQNGAPSWSTSVSPIVTPAGSLHYRGQVPKISQYNHVQGNMDLSNVPARHS